MIVELVTFNSPEGWDRAQVLEDAKGVVPKWAANPDLMRKHFLLGHRRGRGHRRRPLHLAVDRGGEARPRRRLAGGRAQAHRRLSDDPLFRSA